MDKKGEVLVPLHIADSSVTKDGEVKEDRSQIMELLQKMANNFDNGVNELNNKLQMMENRINNIESSTLPIQPAKIPIDTETPIEIPTEIIQNTINDLNLQDDQKIEDDVEDDQKIDDELILQEDVKSNIQVVSTKDETWWKNKKDDVEEVEDKKNIVSMIRENDSNDVPISVLDEPSKPTKEHVKGSMGWLKEQKRLKEQRAKR